jgi:DNA mismatch endonuclease (patch repair protein)
MRTMSKGRDTRPEMALRRELWRRGRRYRVDHPLPLPGVHRRADLVFSKARLAVFVDGCYWHVCPAHGTEPRTNAEYWSAKLRRNVARDRETDQLACEAGWGLLRVWEHEKTMDAADRVEAALRALSRVT